MDDLLSIGAFSRMTFLSVKTLRHYHDVGLLEPARIDPHSGYRFYRPDQVTTAHLIRRFRDLDLPIDQLRQVLDAPDAESRDQVLVAHLDQMTRQLKQTHETVESLRRLLLVGDPGFEVSYRTDPTVWALTVTERVAAADVVDWWVANFTELRKVLAGPGIHRLGADGALFSTEFFTDEIGELTAFVPVDVHAGGSGRVQIREIDGADLAVVRHDGSLNDLDLAYAALGRHVVQRLTETGAPIRERYLPIGAEDDLLNHVTEVCWPVGP